MKNNERNHLLAPRSVFNTTKLYTFYILKELSKGKSLYGKQIYDIFQEHFSLLPVPVSYSTIYDTLHKMEEFNYVESRWNSETTTKNRSTRYYTITDEGFKYYKTHCADFVDTLKKNKSIIDKFIELMSK